MVHSLWHIAQPERVDLSMFSAGAHGQFEIFNISPTDAYLALRHQTSPYWQLFRMHSLADGYRIERVGQHTTFDPGVLSHAAKDAETRHNHHHM